MFAELITIGDELLNRKSVEERVGAAVGAAVGFS